MFKNSANLKIPQDTTVQWVLFMMVNIVKLKTSRNPSFVNFWNKSFQFDAKLMELYCLIYFSRNSLSLLRHPKKQHKKFWSCLNLTKVTNIFFILYKIKKSKGVCMWRLSNSVTKWKKNPVLYASTLKRTSSD